MWDQNFDPFDSGNIHIEQNKEPGFTFSIELETKFVRSHGLIKLHKDSRDSEIYFIRFQLLKRDCKKWNNIFLSKKKQVALLMIELLYI